MDKVLPKVDAVQLWKRLQNMRSTFTNRFQARKSTKENEEGMKEK